MNQVVALPVALPRKVNLAEAVVKIMVVSVKCTPQLAIAVATLQQFHFNQAVTNQYIAVIAINHVVNTKNFKTLGHLVEGFLLYIFQKSYIFSINKQSVYETKFFGVYFGNHKNPNDDRQQFQLSFPAAS